MMYIKSTLVNQFGFHPNCYKVKDNCKATEDQIVKSDKVLAITLLRKLLGIKCNNSKIVHEHIMRFERYCCST